MDHLTNQVMLAGRKKSASALVGQFGGRELLARVACGIGPGRRGGGMIKRCTFCADDIGAKAAIHLAIGCFIGMFGAFCYFAGRCQP